MNFIEKKKSSEKKHMKDINIFQKKKERKCQKRPEKDIKFLLKKKKKKTSILS